MMLKIPYLLTILFFTGCLSSLVESDKQGNSSETVATGTVIDSNGKSRSAVSLRLLNPGHDPVANTKITMQTTSDKDGKYHFKGIDSGTYNLEAVDSIAGEKALIKNIQILPEKNVTIKAFSLKQTGHLSVYFPEKELNAGDYLYIPGTTVYSISGQPDSSRSRLTLTDIPSGVYEDIRFVHTEDTLEANLLEAAMSIAPLASESLTVIQSLRKFSTKIGLNTSSTGANIPEDITNIPILIRLNGNNFNFSQAQSGGEDIRFFKPDNSPLAYEIERWDSPNQRAEIWVKMDTVFADNNQQFIIMAWGNSGSADNSDGKAVFDTANGFAGVWHLGENSATVSDATPSLFHGLRVGSQSQLPGIIGFAQSYRNTGSYSDMGDVLNADTSSLTVSAWIKLGRTGGIHTLVGKTNGGISPYPDYGWLMSIADGMLRFNLVSDGAAWGDVGSFWLQSKPIFNETETWYFVSAVLDRSNSNAGKLYVNGVDVTDVRLGEIAAVGKVTNNLSFRLAAEADGEFPFTGDMDELVISRTARSESWIRLTYMNQKPMGTLVEFNKEN